MDGQRKPENLQGWCNQFRIIYEKANENKKWSELIAMLGARICLLVSPKYYEGLGDFGWQFAKSVAWMLAIHNSQAKPFSDDSPFGFTRDVGTLLLVEFPKACPYCGQEECDYKLPLHTSGLRREHRNATLAKYNELAHQDTTVKSFSLDAWAQTILAIYPRDRERPLPSLSGKLAEEFAELAKALRLYRRAMSPRNGASAAKSSAPKGLETLRGDYSEEFADAFSRLCVLGWRVLGETVSLDKLVWNTYKHGCPTCVPRLTNGPECACETVEVTAEAVTLWNQQAVLGKTTTPTVNIQIENRLSAGIYTSASIHIAPGDFEGVRVALRRHHVAEDDIEELRKAFENDKPPKSKDALGERTGTWVGKMVGKASRGLWKVGSATAADLLAKIILGYHGIPLT